MFFFLLWKQWRCGSRPSQLGLPESALSTPSEAVRFCFLFLFLPSFLRGRGHLLPPLSRRLPRHRGAPWPAGDPLLLLSASRSSPRNPSSIPHPNFTRRRLHGRDAFPLFRHGRQWEPPNSPPPSLGFESVLVCSVLHLISLLFDLQIEARSSIPTPSRRRPPGLSSSSTAGSSSSSSPTCTSSPPSTPR